jgi:hypothetical protein
MLKRRRRIKQTTSLSERLHQFAEQARDQARRLPECAARGQLIKKIEVTERALELEGYLTSRELQSRQR